MSSHDQHSQDARSALMQTLKSADAPLTTNDVVQRVLEGPKQLSVEAVKSAIWALARTGEVEVDWSGQVSLTS
jgi:hypothetical protein